MKVVGATSALGFMAIDLWYAARRQISLIYLLDAAAEAALAAGWVTERS